MSFANVSHADYVKAQLDSESHETYNPMWSEGQRRWVKFLFSPFNRETVIYDIACGDGIGLIEFGNMGFTNVVGFELNDNKARIAAASGYKVYLSDKHDLGMIPEASAHVIYSSHTLEHARDYELVLNGFKRLLKPLGLLYLILPYPDMGEKNRQVHCGKYSLGTNIDDDADTVIERISACGFDCTNMLFDSAREPEVFLSFVKRG